MLRALSDLESFYIENGVAILTISDLEGIVNPLLLQNAIETVVMKHPLLFSEVRKDGDKDYFYSRDAYADKMTVTDKVDKDKRKQLIFSELNTPLTKNSLVRFSLLLEERLGMLKSQNISLIITTHHAVSDGISCVALQEQIWKTYAELASNQTPTLPTYSLMPAVEDLIPNHFTQAELSDYIERYMQTAKHYHPFTLNTADKDAGELEIKYIKKKFTIKQTKAILQRCQQQDISVHGAISAAHVLAMKQLSRTEGSIDISCHTPVNIRPLLNPPMANDVMLSAAIGCTHYQSVSSDVSQKALAEAITSTVKNSMENGDIFKSLLTVRETRLKVFLATSIGISNVGVVNFPPISRRLKLTAMNFMGRFPFAMLTAYVATSDNKLTILYPYAKPFYSTKSVSRLVDLAAEYLLTNKTLDL